MKRRHILLSILAWCISAALISLAISGCGALVALHAKQAKFDEINSTVQASDSEDSFLVDVAHKFGLMALFAEVVYRRDLKDSEKDGQGCRYLDGKHVSM